MSHDRNRQLLADALGQQHLIVEAEGPAWQRRQFDLCVVDVASHQRWGGWLRQRKAAQRLVFLPALLVVSRSAPALPEGTWSQVDETVCVPVRRVELQRRIDTLLGARALSVEADRRRMDLQQRNDELDRLQRRMGQQNEELRRLSEAKSRFVGMAAHDLRTPLAVLRTYADFLLSELQGGEAQGGSARALLPAIRASGDYMLELVEDLLDVTELEGGHLRLTPESVEVGSLVEHAVSLNRVLAAGKGIGLTTRGPKAPVRAYLDQVKMRQVLDNLVGNAIKYSPADTEVEVAWEGGGGLLQLSVRDAGPGLPPGDLERIFEPFERRVAGGVEGGTGLGLAIVRRIVEGHGGRVWAEGAAGGGAIFRVELPLADDRASATSGAKLQEAPTPISESTDRAAQMAWFRGDTEALRIHVERFLAECEGMVGAVQTAATGRQWKKLERAAYKLAWRLRPLGALAALEAALRMERAGHEERDADIPPLVGELTRQVAGLVAELSAQYSGSDGAARPGPGGPLTGQVPGAAPPKAAPS